MGDLKVKYQKLLDYLKGLESVAVAFSGGVDSTFLLAAAKEALGDNVIALTAKSCLFPESESGEAQQFCKNIGVKQIVLDLGDTELPSFQHNPPNRCYICKKGLFQKFLEKAKENQMVCVAEGSWTILEITVQECRQSPNLALKVLLERQNLPKQKLGNFPNR